jgi:hypothetical protein
VGSAGELGESDLVQRLREDLELQRKIDLQIIAEKRALRAALERIVREWPHTAHQQSAIEIAREALRDEKT